MEYTKKMAARIKKRFSEAPSHAHGFYNRQEARATGSRKEGWLALVVSAFSARDRCR